MHPMAHFVASETGRSDVVGLLGAAF